jgi:penicillin-binding protein 2
VAVTPIQLARAIGGITSDGALHRPHVAFPDALPPNFKQAQAAYPDLVQLPIDNANWVLITDAMANVVNPIGTAPSAHLEGIDFAGKTGSAQTISNVAKARLAGNKSKFKDNGWFVGVTPRRNPEIVVTVLLEEGEHGYLAARVCAQVIKAYVEKQRKRGLKMAGTAPGEVEVGALWNVQHGADGSPDGLQGGRFRLRSDGTFKPARAAPQAAKPESHVSGE